MDAHRGRFIIVLATSAMLAVGISGVASAARGGGGNHGGGGGGGTISLSLMDGATEAHHYGRVTFDVHTTATDRPFVGLRCWQGADWVYDAYVGYFPGAMFDQWFVLDSNYWVDGVAATCTARLFYYNKRGGQNVLTTLDFPVAP